MDDVTIDDVTIDIGELVVDSPDGLGRAVAAAVRGSAPNGFPGGLPGEIGQAVLRALPTVPPSGGDNR